jgi:predicted NodU family carbamoyl transferase
MAYNILAINPGHNGSTALVSDGEIIFYGEEERFSHMKYDANPYKSMLHALTSFKIDEFIMVEQQMN